MAKIQRKAHLLSNVIADECVRRYGCSYSDVDADGIIDTLDYLGSEDGYSLVEFDEPMTTNDKARRIDLRADCKST